MGEERGREEVEMKGDDKEESHFRSFVGREEDVGWLDVPMNDALVRAMMQVLHSPRHPQRYLVPHLPCQYLPPPPLCMPHPNYLKLAKINVIGAIYMHEQIYNIK